MKKVEGTLKKGCQKVSKAALETLGKMSLDDKVKAALEKADDDATAAELLKQSLTKVEHSKLWQKHKVHMKNHPDEGLEGLGDGLAKREKGHAVALWFVKKSRPTYMNMQMSMEAHDSVTKLDQWQSEKQMLDRFGESEMQRHLNSGRILWRADPWTKDVYQYKDQGDISRTSVVQRGKKLNLGQEYEADDDHADWFNEIFDQDLC